MTRMSIQAAVPPGGASADPGMVASAAKDTARIHDAAQQFEALLLGQILRSARESDGGWLGGGDSAGDSLTEFAEQQLASTMAQQGGLGLADLISQGLAKR